MRIKDNRTLDIEYSLNPTEDSIGIVIGNRDDTEKNTLKLYIPRFMQGIDVKEGKCIDESASIKNSKILNSVNKNVGSSTIKLKNYIEVPPFLVPGVNPPRYEYGERVVVKFMDEDIKTPIYFPFQLHDVGMRKDDIMRYFVPSKENIDDPIVDENSYFIELNSKDKFVRLFTSNKNEEKCPFTFNINTKDGIVTFKDDTEKRCFEWNYDEDKLYWGTDNGIEFEFKETAARLVCETLDIQASESIKMETSKFLLKADQGDFEIDNMFVKNTSYEQQASNSKLKYDLAELSGNLWQIISSGLFLDAPATINTGMSVFAGFYVTKVPAPGKTPSVYAGGALDGASPQSSSTPTSQQPNPMSPSTEATGSTSMTDMKGNKAGQPLAYAMPVITCLTALATQADLAAGWSKFHFHFPDYIPLCPHPSTPSIPKPNAMMEKTTTITVSTTSPNIPAVNFKA